MKGTLPRVFLTHFNNTPGRCKGRKEGVPPWLRKKTLSPSFASPNQFLTLPDWVDVSEIGQLSPLDILRLVQNGPRVAKKASKGSKKGGEGGKEGPAKRGGGDPDLRFL